MWMFIDLCVPFAQRLPLIPWVTMLQHAGMGYVVVRDYHLCDVVVDFCRRAHLSVTVEKGHGLTGDQPHQTC